MKNLKKILIKVSKTAIIRILIEPISFIINGSLKLEMSVLNVLNAIIEAIYKSSLLFKDNFANFFKLLFHVNSSTWKDFITSIGQLIVLPFCKSIEIISSLYSRFSTKRKINRNIRKIKRAVLSSKTLLLGSALSCFVLLSTTACQIISFYTTYRGLDYYFGDVFVYATLLITLVIQVGLLILSNASVNKQRFNSKRKFMMIFFMCISILFSYTGIMNSQNSPEEEYKSLYNDFYTDYKLAYDDLVSKTTVSASFNIDEINYAISNIKNKAKSKINALYSQNQNLYYKINEYSNDDDTNELNTIALNNVNIETLQIDVQNIDGYTINSSDITKAELNNKKISEILTIANDNSKTKYQDVKNEYDNLKNDLLSMDAKLRIDDLPDSLGELYQKYYNGKQIKDNNLACKEYYDIKKELLSVNGKSVTKDDAIITKLKNNKEINDLLYALDNEVQEKFINNEFIKKGMPSKLYDKVLKKAQNYLAHPDINVIALKKLWPLDNAFKSAIVVFLIAMFIDGITVLMPIMIEKTKNSILYAKSRKDLVYEEEDLFEELLMDYNLINGNDIASTINKLNDHFKELKQVLKPVPELEDIGYVMYITDKDFKELLESDYTEFYIFSQQCTYIQFMPNDVFKTSLKIRSVKNITINDDVYLVKGKFIIWLRQNFKELKGLGKGKISNGS